MWERVHIRLLIYPAFLHEYDSRIKAISSGSHSDEFEKSRLVRKLDTGLVERMRDLLTDLEKIQPFQLAA